MSLTPSEIGALPPELRATLFAPRVSCGGPPRRLYDKFTGAKWAQKSWWPHVPTPRQAAFLLYQGSEALYGGAAGGGKTDAALMAASQYICVPGYNAIIFRQTYGQLAQDDGLIERSHEWWAGTGATYNAGAHRWTFPSGASVTFGSLQYEKDKHKYQGAAYHFVYFDELTNFPTSGAFTYLFSRLRRKDAEGGNLAACPHCGLTQGDIPLRMRAGTNPGGVGGSWVFDRFVAPWRDMLAGKREPNPDRVFIPSLLKDNPYLDYDAYLQSLQQLDPVERAQLLEGDWDVRARGAMFDRFLMPIVDDWPREAKVVRYYDFASTEDSGKNDPDWTAGAFVAVLDGKCWLVHVDRYRAAPGELERRVKQRADLDTRRTPIVMEREGGASGKIAANHFIRNVLPGFEAYAVQKSNSKADEARPLSALVLNGNFSVVRGEWNEAWFDEAEMFPKPGYHDDQVDAVSGGFNWLNGLSVQGRGGLRA